MEDFLSSKLISLSLFSLLSSSAIMSAMGEVHREDLSFVRTMDKKLIGPRREKLSRFKLYWHDILSGPRPTSVQIVPPLAKSNTTDFGRIQMIDNPLTLGLGLNSTLVGRAQGIYGQASQGGIAFLMAMNLAFTQGKYNESTITLLGRNPALSAVRELPVVGGSGLFRFATGYALLKTRMFDPTTGDATVEYKVSVLHY